MRILIIRLSSIGDIILTEPVIRCLHKQVPNARIDYLTKQQYVPLVKLFDGINLVVPYIKQSQAIRALKNNRYDVVIDLHSKPRTWLIRLLLRAGNKVTYRKKHLLRYLRIKKLIKKEIVSTVKLYFSVFRKLDMLVPERIYHPRISLSGKKLYLQKKLKGELDAGDKKLIGVFPGAMHFTKRYPVEMLAQFINHFSDLRDEYLFLLIGSKQDDEQCRQLSELCYDQPVNWCGRFELDELAVVISMLDLVITNDSGPMHLAAALGKKQIAIFGATHPCLGFKPLNDGAVILQVELSCRPCSLHGGKKCPHGHFLCMRSLMPEMLEEAVESLNL